MTDHCCTKAPDQAMRIAESARLWFETPPGQQLLRQEQQALEEALQR